MKQAIMAAALMAGATTHAYPQGTTPADPPAEQGRERFQRHCAICHGDDARGFGLFLSQLKVKPADLTLLAKKNGGSFPLRAVYDAIDGRVPAAHGSRDMPIWGTAFKGYVASGSETLVRGRILELILYLESIQRQ